MNSIDTFNSFHSSFRTHHSTETALMKVSNDLLLTANGSDCTVLVLLVPFSAFDTIDQSVLQHHLEIWVDLMGTALHLIRSHLSNRTSVVIANACYLLPILTVAFLKVLSLAHCCFQYMFSLSQIIQNHSISHYCYIDDVPLQTNNPRSMDNLFACFSDVKCWLSKNVLKFNNKSEVIVIGPTNSTSLLHSKLGSLTRKH